MIRQLEPSDIRRVMEIWLNGNAEAHSFIPREYWEANFAMVQAQILQAEVWVCEENGEIQGFIGLAGGWIAGIFVDEKYRSQGLGKQLLEHAKAKHDSLSLSVYEKNPRAMAFYRREGFSLSAEGRDEATGEVEYTMAWKAETRKTVLFIAMSLDGYIADSCGDVSWLHGQGTEEEIDTYATFVKDVDTVLMGWNTYHQIVTELSPEEWVYGDLMSYVFTHNKCDSTEQIRFTDAEPADMVRTLKQQRGKDIWICGGANLIGQLMGENLIDRYYISVIPVLLGSGIRLFGAFPQSQELRLVKTQSYDGIVELIYERRQPLP